MLVSYIFIQEAGDEEKKEVSLALKKLRKQYDDIHKMTVEKENELELLKVSHFDAYYFFADWFAKNPRGRKEGRKRRYRIQY